MSTTDTSAYLPSVYKNAYRYDDITSNSIVFKNSASSFSSIVPPTNPAKAQVLQISTAGEYSWVDPSAAALTGLTNEGAVVSSEDGTIYDVAGMNNADYYAVALKYSATDKKYTAQALTSIVSVAGTNDGNYYLSYVKDTSAWSAVAFPSDAKAYIVNGGSYAEATISNLFGLATPTQNELLILTATGYQAAELPTESGDYHLVISAANALPSFTKNSNLDVGGNLEVDTGATAFLSLTSSPTAIFSAITTTSGYKYQLTMNMDIYVTDITKLVSDTLSDADFVNALPEVVIKAGTDTLATYTVKTNQPLQTITVSRVISATGATYGAITAEIKFNGVPAETADFIKLAKVNSIFGTYTSCGLSA